MIIFMGITMSKEIIADLTAPWSHDEIKWRVGSLTKDKTKTKPLAYIDARTVMERLDAAVGVENWQDRYEFHGTRTLCYLSIRINGEWICKSDGAGDSDIESEKGGLSDAFKRASVKWGMGRELYEMKTRWMPVDEFKQMVGNPWDFVIKTGGTPKAPNPPKPVAKDETPEGVTDRLIQAIKKQPTVAKLKEWENLQIVKDARDRLFMDDNILCQKVDDAFNNRHTELTELKA